MRTHTSETQRTTTPAQALQYLKEGNARFVNNLKVNRNLLEQANETRDGQWPFAVILSCIDSRTSAELIFDQGLGDIFSVRIAGNVVNPDIIGCLEFASKLSGSKLIVVLGHTSCGAIKGACDNVQLGNLSQLLAKIRPAVDEASEILDPADCKSSNPAFLERVIELNVRRSVASILTGSSIIEELVAQGQVAIVGGKHDLSTGVVQFYDDTWVSDAASFAAVVKRPAATDPAPATA